MCKIILKIFSINKLAAMWFYLHYSLKKHYLHYKIYWHTAIGVYSVLTAYHFKKFKKQYRRFLRYIYSPGEGFKIVTITGNTWDNKYTIRWYFVALTGRIPFTKEVVFITAYRFGLFLLANKSKVHNFHPTPLVLYQCFLWRALN